MNWRTLLTSPPPDTVWSLDHEVLTVSRRDRGDVFRCAATELPPTAVELGPVGLQSLARPALDGAISTLLKQGVAGRTPALILPTGWTRMFLIEGTDVPTRKADLDDVLRWRLKKLLPAPPSDLRLATAHQPVTDEQRQLVCVTIRERPMAELEAVFGEHRVTHGLVVPRVLALALAGEGDRLVVEQDDTVLAFVLVARDGIRFARTKPLPPNRAAWPDVGRELRLTLDFVRTKLAIEGDLTVRWSAIDGELARDLVLGLEKVDRVRVRPPASGAVCPDSVLAQRLGSARLAPMAAVFEGGAP